MFNLKNKTLAIAISMALGLSACGDNDPKTKMLKEAQKRNDQLPRAEQIEIEIAKDIARESSLSDYYEKRLPNIQKKVLELFPANNVRMEKNLENCHWYVANNLVPAWSADITGKESEYIQTFGKILGTAQKTDDGNYFSQKYIELIKDVFFYERSSGNKVFNEFRLNDDIFLKTFVCALIPESYSFYLNDEKGFFAGNGLDAVTRFDLKSGQRSNIRYVSQFIEQKITQIKYDVPAMVEFSRKFSNTQK